MSYKEVEGDLISLAKSGHFDVIAHGCNCKNCMGGGLAPLIARAFGANKFPMEHDDYEGNVNKLGTIDYKTISIVGGELYTGDSYNPSPSDTVLIVVNAYTQFGMGKNELDGSNIALDYEALTMCMRKMNYIFKGLHIGLPLIGAGLAGGNWTAIKSIIQNELRDCNITVVHYKQ